VDAAAGGGFAVDAHDKLQYKTNGVFSYFNKGGFMPRGDGTGPAGMGPMTGRRAGYCAGYQIPGYANNAGFWGGQGFGRGGNRGGRGFRNRFYGEAGTWGWRGQQVAPAAPVVPQQATDAGELEALKSRSAFLENELGAIRSRMEKLEKGDNAR